MPSVAEASGAYYTDTTGKRWLDAVASWWVTLHGHCEPHIAEAIAAQASKLDQVIFANFTHPKAVELVRRLLSHLPESQARAFFTDDGSTAVEVAIKMALQYWYNQDAPRGRILTLEGAYHGDTFGSMSASARSLFTEPFQEKLFAVDALPLPVDASTFAACREQLERALADGDVAAFLFEPCIQGVAGMRIYPAAHLDVLVALCREAGVPCIADEVFTGFGRTGRMFATDALENAPDIFCLSKGITGGFIPLGLTTCSETIYASFSADDARKRLYHGHSYTANPLACAAACASLDLLETPETWERISCIEAAHAEAVEQLAACQQVREARSLGTIFAAEIAQGSGTAYLSNLREHAQAFFAEAGIFVRPLGNIIYFVPPYCISEDELEHLHGTLRRFLETL